MRTRSMAPQALRLAVSFGACALLMVFPVFPPVMELGMLAILWGIVQPRFRWLVPMVILLPLLLLRLYLLLF